MSNYSTSSIVPNPWPELLNSQEATWEFVADFGQGSIWHRDGEAVYLRCDRRLYYPTCEGQEYLADDGVYRVVDGCWLKDHDDE